MLVDKICKVHKIQENVTGCPLCRVEKAKERSGKNKVRGRSGELKKQQFDVMDFPGVTNPGKDNVNESKRGK